MRTISSYKKSPRLLVQRKGDQRWMLLRLRF
nr:MAG TPA: hypothetical protein [Bacteriophage sp.]